MLVWQLYRNLENSLKYFLDTQVIADSVTDIDGNNVSIYVGRKSDNTWTIPCITISFDIETNTRLEIGSNLRDDRYLIILDIYATNEGERLDLAKWLRDSLEDGFRYYSYTYNISNPDSPTKVAGGLVNVDFLTNTRVDLGQNVDTVDAHRHRISIQTWISGS